jgi:hypothetical protein
MHLQVMDILHQLQQGASMDTFSTMQLYAALQSRQSQDNGTESKAPAVITSPISKNNNKSNKSLLRVPLRLSISASTSSTTPRTRTQTRTTSSKSNKSARKTQSPNPHALALTATNDRLNLSLSKLTASASARRTPSSSSDNYNHTSKLNGSNDDNGITRRTLVTARRSPSKSVKASRKAYDTPNVTLFLEGEGPEVHRMRYV